MTDSPTERYAAAREFLALPSTTMPSCQDTSDSDEAFDSGMCWNLLREASRAGVRGFREQHSMTTLLLRADALGWREGRKVCIPF